MPKDADSKGGRHPRRSRKQRRREESTDPYELARNHYNEIADEDEADGQQEPGSPDRLATFDCPKILSLRASQREAVIVLALFPVWLAGMELTPESKMMLEELRRTSIDREDATDELFYSKVAHFLRNMKYMPSVNARRLQRARGYIVSHVSTKVPIPRQKSFKKVIKDIERYLATEKKGQVISMSPDTNVAVLELQRSLENEKLKAIFRQERGPVSGLADDKNAWQVATDVIGVVRSQASQYIPKQFGEGIPKSVHCAELRTRIRDFLRRVAEAEKMPANAEELAEDFSRLLKTLREYDGSAEHGVELVLTGAQLVIDLTSSRSIWGLFAQLNVLVMAKPLIEPEEYINEMERLASEADIVRADPWTKKCIYWLNRLPKDRRLPGPGRFRSYVMTNNATRRLDGLITGKLQDVAGQLAAVQRLLNELRMSKDGFELNGMTELLFQCVRAKLLGGSQHAEAIRWLIDLGKDEAEDLLLKVRDYEDSATLVSLVKSFMLAAYPDFRSFASPDDASGEDENNDADSEAA